MGSFLPSRIVTNHELAQTIDTSHDWIVRRTGITQRHIASQDDTTSGLAVRAAQNALSKTDLSSDDIDLVVLATSTPDHGFPATASRIQGMLGIAKGSAFDIQAACAGFIFALQAANNMIMLGQATKALVIGSEIFSRLIDWNERATCILFGDGAGAVILDSRPLNNNEKISFDSIDKGIIDCLSFVDGSGYNNLFARSGLGDLHTKNNLHKHGVYMNGSAIYKAASNLMADSVKILMKRNNISIDKIDKLIPHQANLRIINSMASGLGLNEDKVVVTVDTHANTSAASIPLAIDKAFDQKLISEGKNIILTSLGGGISWGGALIRL